MIGDCMLNCGELTQYHLSPCLHRRLCRRLGFISTSRARTRPIVRRATLLQERCDLHSKKKNGRDDDDNAAGSDSVGRSARRDGEHLQCMRPILAVDGQESRVSS